MLRVEYFLMTYLGLTRLINGILLIYYGELSVEQPEWVFDVLGHYPVPKNFGWDWVAPALVADPVGDEYDYATNLWMLNWNVGISFY